jgi:hypothetical protein
LAASQPGESGLGLNPRSDRTSLIQAKTRLEWATRLLRHEINLGPDEHISIRYEYTNITAPRISP